MKDVFRVVAFLEGVSYILLLFIAVPIRYLVADELKDEYWVKLLGMPHGILFLVYILMAFLINEEEKWNRRELFIVVVCSVLPFGTFYIDRKYLKK